MTFVRPPFPQHPPTSALGFAERYGRAPEQDDLERATCPKAGEPGHWLCGVCDEHALPRFMCGCQVRRP